MSSVFWAESFPSNHGDLSLDGAFPRYNTDNHPWRDNHPRSIRQSSAIREAALASQYACQHACQYAGFLGLPAYGRMP